MASTKIGFDDVSLGSKGYAPIPSNYAGFAWTNVDVFDTQLSELKGTGYAVAATSGHQAAVAPHAKPWTVSLSGGSFDVKSIEMTAAFDTKLKVEVIGFKDGEKIYDKTFSVTDGHPTELKIAAKGVDELEFDSKKGTHDPNSPGKGAYVAFDDLVVANVVGGKAAHADGAGFAPHEMGAPFAHAPLDLLLGGHHPIA